MATKYTFQDDLSITESEFDEYTYSYAIMDPQNECMAMCCTEESAQKVVDALNATWNANAS